MKVFKIPAFLQITVDDSFDPESLNQFSGVSGIAAIDAEETLIGGLMAAIDDAPGLMSAIQDAELWILDYTAAEIESIED